MHVFYKKLGTLPAWLHKKLQNCSSKNAILVLMPKNLVNQLFLTSLLVSILFPKEIFSYNTLLHPQHSPTSGALLPVSHC